MGSYAWKLKAQTTDYTWAVGKGERVETSAGGKLAAFGILGSLGSQDKFAFSVSWLQVYPESPIALN